MGMFGDPKSLKLKDLVDQEKLHRIAVLEVLTHFENDPQIAAPAAKNVLGSLSALLEPFIDMPAQQEPVFYLQVVRVINRIAKDDMAMLTMLTLKEVVRVINRIANQNSDAIRSTMKEVNLLERRDQILVRCLRPPISKEGAFAIMQGFSFEWVAEKASFREAFGLGHLLHILHAFPDEPDLQIGVGYTP
ncbi:hypothetical protein T484DRAFT_1850954 [Baffinella frigidus]|nr:hypothetical protein T484DRAFT_1850954 [Cryptophyta sp. CCMP2293]